MSGKGPAYLLEGSCDRGFTPFQAYIPARSRRSQVKTSGKDLTTKGMAMLTRGMARKR